MVEEYQYLLGKVSTIATSVVGSLHDKKAYQYLLGKVSTQRAAGYPSWIAMYQYLLGKVSTRTFLPRLAEALIVTCN